MAMYGNPVECVSAYFSPESKVQRSSVFPMAFSQSSQQRDFPTDHLSLRQEIMANNILGTAKSQQGERACELVAVSFHTHLFGHGFIVEIFDFVTIRILLKAHQVIAAPNVGFSLFDRMNNLVFSSSTLQQRCFIGALRPGEDRIITFRIQFTVQPGEYTFAIGCGEPDEVDRNSGYTHHRCLGLGPVTVVASSKDSLPFYGIAALPMEVH
jgi:hypothetical protein